MFLPVPILVPASKCIKAVWNYKRGASSEEEWKRFLKSCENGMEPLHGAIRKEHKDKSVYEICDGNHRLDAVNELGIKKVLLYDHGVLSLPERKAIALRYNEWGFESDSVKKAQIILDVTEDVLEFQESMPYSEEELDLMEAMLRSDTVKSNEPVSTEYVGRGPYNKVKTIICPECGGTFNL